MSAIILICLSILFVSYFSGKIINFIFFKNDNSSFISVGFFSLLGILQFCTYILASFQVNTKIMFIVYFLVMFLTVTGAFILKLDLKPNRNDLIALFVGLIICVIGIVRIQTYTLGEKYLDSTFYLSMVNENSVKSVYGGMDYYSGKIRGIDFIYDYQSFYAVFSMFLKLVNNLNIGDMFSTPIYFYSSTITYLIMFGATLSLIIKKVLNNSLIQSTLFLVVTSLIFFKYYHYALAFIGNSYRVMGVSLGLLVFNEHLIKKDNKLLLLVGLLFSGLIAVSSSGVFMGLFAFASFLIYFILKNDKDAFLYGLVGFIPVLIYTALIFLENGLIYSLLILFILMIYYLFAFKFIDYKYFFKGHRIIIILVLIGLIGISYFIEKSSIYKYGFFFNDHSAYDMVHDYFSYYHKNVFYPTLSIWVLFGLFLVKNNSEIKKVILIMILFFINPLVTPFIIKYLTNFVFYRSFELIFNLTFLALFISTLKFNKYFEVVVATLLTILVLPYSYKQFINNFSDDMKSAENYNSYYRITNEEIDLYTKYKEIAGDEHKIILSQIASTKAYLNNIELVFSVFETRSADQFNEIKQEAPSELLNIFFPRDFVGQIVYDSLPDYEKMNDLVVENKIDYLFLRKDQAIIGEDGNFIHLYLKLKEICDIVYENDLYVILKNKY